MTSNRFGKLELLETKRKKFCFWLYNLLLIGALQSRVEKVVYYSFLTLTLEFNNPFNLKVLKYFLDKKLKFLNALISHLAYFNGKAFDCTSLSLHITIFHRNSLLQARLIRQMHQAVKHHRCPNAVKQAQAALDKGLTPLLITQGLSGAYWMRGPEREILGLFKPFDEEIHAPNNPVGPLYRGALGLRKTRHGCRVGEAAHHEVAAFLVDRFFGFGIVPHTYYASFFHSSFFLSHEDPNSLKRSWKLKYGSFQEYIKGFVSLIQLSNEELAAIPLDEYQLLILLDVIIGNTDRHAGNILVGHEKIAAIDHGLCFPDSVEAYRFWYWATLAQGTQPFLPSIVELIQKFPFEALAHKLRRCQISISSLERLHERVVLFREAVQMGLVAAEMAQLMQPKYLLKIYGLNTTLDKAAAQQIDRYKSEGMV